MESVTPGAPTSFSLRGRRARAITLEADGLRHPTGARRGGMVFSAYRGITHLATSTRAVWIGTRRSVYAIGRKAFVDPHGPEHLVRALLAAIAREPGGSEQLARMAQIEEMARVRTPLRATWGLLLVCLAVFVVQVLGGQSVSVIGYFTGELAFEGDWWRVVTANLLHANALHLIVNGLGLVGIGSLVERSLGSTATICVMVCAGVGAMAASAVWSELPVVGVSGVLCGLLAALAWLELRFAERLPAWWRVPRRALVWTLVVSALLSFLPVISASAHAGGFVGGGLATVALAWRRLRPFPRPTWVTGFATASVATTVIAIAAAGYQLSHPSEFAARHVARLLARTNVSAEELNNTAWMIAVEESSSTELLEGALRLAERAVDDTGHTKAHILDTLAEVHFQLGHRDEAVAAIEEAILRDPDEDYYREQRRRFLGERDSEDRPELPPQQQPESRPEEPGLSV